ncbi:MAG: ABC transporter substrate-binding protein [Deltaproteobacteria bacterium]|nr:ABC transporter substrate-binding protein [Deltaproteobacteria bacterium]
MRTISLHIVALLLFISTSPASAWEVLVVQNYQAKPYGEVLRGFKSVCNAHTSELLVSEMDGETLSREIRRRAPDLILALGMDALRKVRKIREIPVVYCMVLDAETVLGDEKNITGVSMTIPPDKQLAALVKVLPNLKRIGLVYNPRKTGRIVERMRDAAERRGIRLTALKAESARELPGRLAALPAGLDAYWMLPDSTFTTPEAVESTILFSINNKLPIYTFSEKYLRMGAFMSLDLDTFDLGRQAGQMAEKVRTGTDIRGSPGAMRNGASPP